MVAQALVGALGNRLSNREMNRLLQPGRPVRTLSSQGGAAEARAVHAAAARGTSGPASPLPHVDSIQRSFGRYDVSQVRAHLGAEATAGATEMGAEAFATGSAVAFARPADLRTAAHEAAHVVQQQAGVHLAGGVGSAGDAYEQHADAVAAKVVRGESAEALLTSGIAGPARGSLRVAVQRRITDAGEIGEGVERWDRAPAEKYLKGKSVDSLIDKVTGTLAAKIDAEGHFLRFLETPIRELVRATLIEETIIAGNDQSEHDFSSISGRTHAALASLAEQLSAIQKNFYPERDLNDSSLQSTFSSRSGSAEWYAPWGTLAKGRVKALAMRDEDAETAQEIRSLIHFTTSLSSDADPEVMQGIVTEIAGILQGRHHYSADLEAAIRSRFVKEPNLAGPTVTEDLNREAQKRLQGAEAPSVPPLNVKLDQNLYSIILSAIAKTGLAEGPLLKAIATQQGETLIRLAYVLRFIPKEILRGEFQELLKRPDDLRRVNETLFSLTHIDINASGDIHALSAPVAREMLFASEVHPGLTAQWGATAKQLPGPKPLEKAPPELPGQVSSLIDSRDATALGRTVVLSHPDKPDHSYAIKLLKAKESTLEFERELQMQRFLKEGGVSGLLSLIPTPVGLFRITKEQWVSLSNIIIAKLKDAEIAARVRGEPPVPDLPLEETGSKLNVMVYKAHNSYFTYQHGGGLLKDPSPDFDKSRQAFFHDALVLLRYGIAFPQLIDLNHNADRIYNWMIDIMRVYYLIRGMGKISNWKGAARYPNIRASGLADLGDMRLLSTMEYGLDEDEETNEEVNKEANENESAVGKVWTKMGPQKNKMLIAQYLGNYLLSAVLTEAHGFFVTNAKQFRDSMPDGREAVKKTLTGVLGHTFLAAMEAFSKAFDAPLLPSELITAEELGILADQMLYFLGGEYVADARDALLAPGLDDPKGRLDKPKEGNRFDARLPEIFPRVLVPLPPIMALDEQQAALSETRQVLGSRGIYSVKVGQTDKQVTSELVDQHPDAARQVDLGFLNGPQPLAELQLILYKIVGYAIMSISQ